MLVYKLSFCYGIIYYCSKPLVYGPIPVKPVDLLLHVAVVIVDAAVAGEYGAAYDAGSQNLF